MKRIIMASMLSFILLLALAPMLTHARAETMHFKLVSMVDKMETVNVTHIEGGVIGVLDRKGLSWFENGDVATTSCRGTFDTKKGFQGYSSIAFDDGSTLVLSWKGPTSRVPPGGEFSGYTATFEYAKGTGRFEGIKGSGTFTAKAPLWNDDYKAKGFTYYEFSGTYTLPSR